MADVTNDGKIVQDELPHSPVLAEVGGDVTMEGYNCHQHKHGATTSESFQHSVDSSLDLEVSSSFAELLVVFFWLLARYRSGRYRLC